MSWLTQLAGARPDPQAAEKVLALPCPLCEAPAGTACDPWSPAAGLARPPCGMCGNPAACPDWCDAAAGLTVLGGDPLTVLHTARVLVAVNAGTVSRKGVLARFAPGEGPHSLQRYVQEART